MSKPTGDQVKITARQKGTLVASDADLHNFARQVLGLKLYPWQDRAMADLSPKYSRVAVRAANGSGKTKMLSAPAAFWNAVTNPGSTTVVTSGVMRQVKEQFWPALREIARKFQGSLNITINTSDMTIGAMDSRIVGFTASDPGMFEGFHTTGEHGSLLIILDEAKSIPDPIFEAVERCQPDRLLVVSSPGASEGAFHRAFSRERDLWKLHVVSAYDCPHIRADWIEFQLRKWGKDHPLVRSMIFADWMEGDRESLVCPMTFVEACLNDPPKLEGNELFAGCDFAAGGDENVLAIRRGNHLDEMVHFREKDTMATVGRFLIEFKQRGIKPSHIFADAGGMGTPMCDALAEEGYNVNRVNFGGRARDPETYLNRGTEMWVETARQIEARSIRLLDDETLINQLVNRRYSVIKSGKLNLESKAECRARGIPSPDRADALVLCFGGTAYHGDGGDVFTRSMLSEVLGDEDESPLAGVFLG